MKETTKSEGIENKKTIIIKGEIIWIEKDIILFIIL